MMGTRVRFHRCRRLGVLPLSKPRHGVTGGAFVGAGELWGGFWHVLLAQFWILGESTCCQHHALVHADTVGYSPMIDYRANNSAM